MDMPIERNTSVEEMMGCIARFAQLRGSEAAFVDSRLHGCRRRTINIICNGVVEQTDVPDLAPNSPLPARCFNLGMIQCHSGQGTALHRHKTEEVFMPLIGAWAVTFVTDEGQKEIVLQPFDTVHVPVGVYRGFRYVGQGRGTLLTLIGGPDAGKVEWTPEVYDAAVKNGLSRDAAGNLRVGQGLLPRSQGDPADGDSKTGERSVAECLAKRDKGHDRRDRRNQVKERRDAAGFPVSQQHVQQAERPDRVREREPRGREDQRPAPFDL